MQTETSAVAGGTIDIQQLRHSCRVMKKPGWMNNFIKK